MSQIFENFQTLLNDNLVLGSPWNSLKNQILSKNGLIFPKKRWESSQTKISSRFQNV